MFQKQAKGPEKSSGLLINEMVIISVSVVLDISDISVVKTVIIC